MKSLPLLGTRAIVLGNGLSGLLSAQALTKHFERVTVICQSCQPDSTRPILLHSQDQAALEALFPGLMAELEAAGAVRFNLGLHMAWFVYSRWRPRYRSTLEAIACSRQLLEKALRRHLEMRPAINFLLDDSIIGLSSAEGAADRIVGVLLDRAGLLEADLVVDAGGQSDRACASLRELGWKMPLPGVKALVTGAGRLYQWVAGTRNSWQSLVVQPTSDQAQLGAVILPLEHDRFHLTLFGSVAGDRPLTEEQFLVLAGSLPTPSVAEAIREAVPLSPVQPLVYNSCQSGSAPLPDRFLAVPQPGRSPNPVFGLEIRSTLGSRMALHDTLAGQDLKKLNGLNRRFQKRLAEHLRLACLLAEAETRRWAGIVDTESASMANYLERVILASLNSAQVLEALYSVQQMLEPPALLFRPDLVLQVVGGTPADLRPNPDQA
jgi:hypothetical protein